MHHEQQWKMIKVRKEVWDTLDPLREHEDFKVPPYLDGQRWKDASFGDVIDTLRMMREAAEKVGVTFEVQHGYYGPQEVNAFIEELEEDQSCPEDLASDEVPGMRSPD